MGSTAVATAEGGAPADADVLARMRNGDHGAYVLLYERYVGPARRLARSILHRSCDVDDVVSEVFAASFAAIRRGRGPKDAFGPYVLSSVRRECYRSWRRHGKRRETVTEAADVERATATVDPADPTERAVLEEAFGSLPDNLRTVLWLTEVEGLSHGEIAMRTASTGPAVAAMAVRARRALAEGYLQAHGGGGEGSLGRDCRAARRCLARVVRGTASDRQLRHVDDHVAGCRECAHARDQLRVVNQRLRELAPPALVGTLGWSRVLVGGFLPGQVAGWLAGPGAALMAVTGAVAAMVALPAAAEGARPAAAVATVTAALEQPAVPAADDAPVRNVVAATPPPFDLRFEGDAAQGLARTGPAAPTAADLAPWTWAVSAGADPPEIGPVPAPVHVPITLPVPPPVAPPAEAAQVAIPAPVDIPVPVPDVEVHIEIDVPELPPAPVDDALTDLLPTDQELDVTVDMGAGGATVDLDADDLPQPRPVVGVEIDTELELPGGPAVVDEPVNGPVDEVLDEVIGDVGEVRHGGPPNGGGPLGDPLDGG